jgi:hypothetical protein
VFQVSRAEHQEPRGTTTLVRKPQRPRKRNIPARDKTLARVKVDAAQLKARTIAWVRVNAGLMASRWRRRETRNKNPEKIVKRKTEPDLLSCVNYLPPIKLICLGILDFLGNE